MKELLLHWIEGVMFFVVGLDVVVKGNIPHLSAIEPWRECGSENIFTGNQFHGPEALLKASTHSNNQELPHLL
jgi:hypothetical protein